MYVMFKNPEDNSLQASQIVKIGYDKELFEDITSSEGLFVCILDDTEDGNVGYDYVNVPGISLGRCNILVAKAYKEGKLDLTEFKIIIDGLNLSDVKDMEHICSYNNGLMSDKFSSIKGLL